MRLPLPRLELVDDERPNTTSICVCWAGVLFRNTESEYTTEILSSLLLELYSTLVLIGLFSDEIYLFNFFFFFFRAKVKAASRQVRANNCTNQVFEKLLNDNQIASDKLSLPSTVV